MKFSEVQFLPDDTILGIDEAGRGPVLGPMIMAHASIQAKDMQKLIDIGVKDSKKLSDKQRQILFSQIKSVIKWGVNFIYPNQIDTCISGLNTLEMEHIAEMTKLVAPKYLIIDSPYAPGANFNLTTFLYEHGVNMSNLHCFAENKADDLYPIVSAASIVAKETRERAMKLLREKYNYDFGSGYPSDPKTKKFIVENWSNPIYTSLIRKSWETYKRLAK